MEYVTPTEEKTHGKKSTVCKYQKAERRKEKGQCLFHLAPKYRVGLSVGVGFTEKECHLMKGWTVGSARMLFVTFGGSELPVPGGIQAKAG